MSQTITLTITPETLDNLTWEQWELFDEGSSPNYKKAREIIALFVEGKTPQEADTLLRTLKTSEMQSVLKQFVEGVNKLRSVNPQTGGA